MSDLIVASLMILKKQCHPPPKKCSSGQMNWWWEQTCSAGWSEKPARSRSHADEWHRGRGIRLHFITRTYFWGRLLPLKLSGFDKLRRPLTLPSNSLGAGCWSHFNSVCKCAEMCFSLKMYMLHHVVAKPFINLHLGVSFSFSSHCSEGWE